MDRLKLYEENEGLVFSVARQWFGKVIEANRDDLLQEARIGLYEASIRYDSTLGFKFSTFAIPCIRGKVLKFIERSLPKIQPYQEDSINTPIAEIGDRLVTYADTISDPDNVETYIQSNLIIREIKENKLLSLYATGCTQKEISKILGISQMTVSRRLNKLKIELDCARAV